MSEVKLRKLNSSDAAAMLEWMHDESVVKYMNADFASKTQEDCLNFIESSQNDSKNIHLAIDVDGEYMGTVSLKNIEGGTAEFAVTVRSAAMGKGIARQAMAEIIRIGLKDLNLNKIYWYVNPENKRAVRFYDKNGYQRVDGSEYITNEGSSSKYIWYRVEKKTTL